MEKYALITGASRGIGRAISVKLATQGYHILINYASNVAAANESLRLIQQQGGEGTLMPFDVADEAATRAAIEAWQDAHPDEYISVLVNNAGIRSDQILALMPAADWSRVLNITLNGFYNVTQPLLMPMQFHKFGRIINMASVSGLRGLPGQTNYSAAKGGLIAATKALAQEVAKKNITVNAIAPGFIQTDMTEGLDEAALKKTIPAGRFGTPEEVAEAVAFLISPMSGYITGNVISINGGLYT
ncbi:MAG: 3-oxoacyl-ACP reductase FabG [Bacteroidaceae bacterium]|nr:3-oxoacyl-ACP reductase FabG [Bacteroidaceae bacterium]